MFARVVSCLFIVATGCTSPAPKGSAQQTTAPELDLREETNGRAVVATANGVPIFEDCIRTQAAERSISVTDALDECIDFELLSQEAARRHPRLQDAVNARKRESVRALLEHEFEPTADSPSDIPAEWVKAKVWSKREVQFGYNHPEYRVAAYALSKYKVLGMQKLLTPENEAKAKALADEWYAALEGKEPIDPQTFNAIVTEVSAGRHFDFHYGYNTTRKGRSVEEFAAALFALNGIGDLTKVTRTRYGYFVIALIKVIPAKSSTFEEALDEIREQVFAKWREAAFIDFTGRLVEKRQVEVFDERLNWVTLDIPDEFRVKK